MAVGPNVSIMLTVLQIRHVYDNIAEIHALVFVVSMLNAPLLTTYRHVLASSVITAIHSLAVVEKLSNKILHKTHVSQPHADQIAYVESMEKEQYAPAFKGILALHQPVDRSVWSVLSAHIN